MKTSFNPENEQNAVSSTRYAEKQQFRSPPGAVNMVGDPVNFIDRSSFQAYHYLTPPITDTAMHRIKPF